MIIFTSFNFLHSEILDKNSLFGKEIAYKKLATVTILMEYCGDQKMEYVKFNRMTWMANCNNLCNYASEVTEPQSKTLVWMILTPAIAG